jgi:hypothetical protein
MTPKKFPKGWDEERVKRVIAHYENQTEDEAVAEDEAAYEDIEYSTVQVPHQLIPEIRELIAKYQKEQGKKKEVPAA